MKKTKLDKQIKEIEKQSALLEKKLEKQNALISKELEFLWPKLLPIKNSFFKEDIGKTLTPEQEKITDDILINAIQSKLGLKTKIINISITRQFGKSFSAFGIIGFMLIHLRKIVERYQDKFNIKDSRGVSAYNFGIVVNTEEQIDKNLSELRDVIDKIKGKYGFDYGRKNNKKTIDLTNGSKITVFIMGSKGSVGNTLDFIAIDEAQFLDYKKFGKTLKPMLLKSGGISVFLGSAADKKNDFYYNLNDKSNKFSNYTFDAYHCIESAKKLYIKTQEISWKSYYQGLENALETEEIDVLKTEYLLQWSSKSSNFINFEKFKTFGKNYDSINTSRYVYVGIDWAQGNENGKGDRTCVVVTQRINGIFTVVDLLKIEEGGLRWSEIGDRVVNFLKKYKVAYIYADDTGVGSVINEMLEDNYMTIEEVKFSEKSKNEMAKNLIAIFNGGRNEISFNYPKNNKYTKDFESEFENLEKKINSQRKRIKFEHPDKGSFHDDFADALALSLLFNSRDQEAI